jgi:hypothetical protein
LNLKRFGKDKLSLMNLFFLNLKYIIKQVLTERIFLLKYKKPQEILMINGNLYKTGLVVLLNVEEEPKLCKENVLKEWAKILNHVKEML